MEIEEQGLRYLPSSCSFIDIASRTSMYYPFLVGHCVKTISLGPGESEHHEINIYTCACIYVSFNYIFYDTRIFCEQNNAFEI